MYVCLVFMWPEDHWTLFLSSHPLIFESLIIPRLNSLAILPCLPPWCWSCKFLAPHPALLHGVCESSYSPHACMSSPWKSLPWPTSLEWKARLGLLIQCYHPPPTPKRSHVFPQPCVTCHPQAIEKPLSQAGRTYLQRVKRTVSSLWEATITSALGLCFNFSRT